MASGLATRTRLGSSGVEDVPAVGPDVRSRCTRPLVVGPWKTKPYFVPESSFTRRAISLSSSQVFGDVEATLLEEVLAVVEQPRVGEPRHAERFTPEGYGLYRAGKEVSPRVLGETVGEVRDPAAAAS